MNVNIQKLISRLEEIYACGQQEDGSHTRMAYSKEDVKGRELFVRYAKDLGMETRMDEAGNLILRLEGADASLPSVVMGSHLDTVPDGGKYDGVLGCAAGLGVCEAYIEAGIRPEHPLEVIVFTDEEGFRFGKGLLGSSAICGQDAEASLEDEDIYGNQRKEVVKSYGIRCEDIEKAKREPNTIHSFVELHIEQGGSLDKKGIPIGIVTTIAGVNRYEITVTGEANHAGSTVMSDRKDALVAAAAFISTVPEIISSCGGEYTVATVGTIKVTPHSVNVIPGTCTFSLEIRDQSQDIMNLAEDRLKALLDETAEKHKVTCRMTRESAHTPAPMSPWIREVLNKASEEAGYPHMELPSGAFHDSLIMSAAFPTGMIFVPSIGGISHSRFEDTRAKDIEKGCDVLIRAIEMFDKMD